MLHEDDRKIFENGAKPCCQFRFSSIPLQFGLGDEKKKAVRGLEARCVAQAVIRQLVLATSPYYPPIWLPEPKMYIEQETGFICVFIFGILCMLQHEQNYCTQIQHTSNASSF